MKDPIKKEEKASPAHIIKQFADIYILTEGNNSEFVTKEPSVLLTVEELYRLLHGIPGSFETYVRDACITINATRSTEELIIVLKDILRRVEIDNFCKKPNLVEILGGSAALYAKKVEEAQNAKEAAIKGYTE